MDNKSTGLFIAENRKAQGLSQKQLAEKLSITDKAVSKWETGNGAPDISLLIPLADMLNVSVVEILNGERIEEKNNIEQTNQIVVDAIKTTEKRNSNRWIKAVIAVAVAVAVLVTSVNFGWYAYWSRRHEVLYDIKTVYMKETEEGYEFRIVGTAKNWRINNNTYCYFLQADVTGMPDYWWYGRSDYIIVQGSHSTEFEIVGLLEPTAFDDYTAKSDMLKTRFSPCLGDRENPAFSEQLDGVTLYMNDYPDAKFIFEH